MLEAWLAKARAGRVPSAMVIAEEIGTSKPAFSIAGRFRADPARAIGPLAVMKAKVVVFAAGQAPDFLEDSAQ